MRSVETRNVYPNPVYNIIMRVRFLFYITLIIFTAAQSAVAQFNPFSNNPSISFSLAWHVTVPDGVKLIDSAEISQNGRQNLLMIVAKGGKDDFRRTLLLTHWDGFRFVHDATASFLGWATDPLLAGAFQVKEDNSPILSIQKGKRKQSVPLNVQIITAGGIFRWTGGGFVRICSPPPNLKFALNFGADHPELMAIGVGDATSLWNLDGTDVKTSDFQLNPADNGSPDWGIGTQSYDGRHEFKPGVYYAQTYWTPLQKWQIGVVPGKSTDASGSVEAMEGDRIAVYLPQKRDDKRTFWQLTHPDDFIEGWKSDFLPGRALDVRVGDPQNNGKIGIMVLVAEKDETRELYFFQPGTLRAH